jgi:uncharacterized protein (TIGR03437 family)
LLHGPLCPAPNLTTINLAYTEAMMKKSTLFLIALLALPFAALAQQQLTSVSPTSLTFAVVNGANPSSQALTITVGSVPSWSAVVTVANGPNGQPWQLNIDNTSGSGNGIINVSVVTAGLAPGNYQGTVTVTSGAATDPIPVTLEIAGAQLSFSAGIGGSNPPNQTLQLSLQTSGSIGSTQTVQWTAAATTGSGGNWLSVSPTSGTTSTLTVSANITGLQIGTYSGLISLTDATFAVGGSTDTYEAVQLTITAPSVTLAPTSLTFGGTFGSTSPAAQTVTVTAANAWIGSVATTSGGPWLSITPTSGTGNGSFSASVALGSLGTGTYIGSITVTAGTGTPVVLNVTLNVAGPTISAAPTSLTFTQVQGTTALAQSVQLAATPATTSWQASESVVNTTVNWLSASPSAGGFPASLLVFPNISAASLAPGSYTGAVNIADPNGSPTALTVNVSLTVTAAPAGKLTVGPTLLSLQTLQGINPAAATLSIGNSGSGTLSWNATATALNGGSWLSISPASGTAALATPAAVQITFNAASLKAGTYTDQIFVSAGSATPQVVTVLLTVTPNGPLFLLGQTGITFNMNAGVSATQTQSVTIANPGSSSLTVNATVVNGSWLTLSPSGQSTIPAGGTTSLSLTATAGTLKAGTDWGLVEISEVGASATLAPQYITVVLNLTAQPTVTTYPIGMVLTPNQLQQSFSMASSSPSATLTAALTVKTLSGGGWLQASPTSLSLNPSGAVVVSTVAASLPTTPGFYQGVVTATFNNGAPSQDVKVTLVIPSTSGAQAQSLRGSAGVTCTPVQLVMAVRALGSSFASTVGWPVNLEAQLVDNCANPITGATVLATFSTGDTPLALANLGGGIYSATWNPASANPATVTIQGLQAPLAPAITTINGSVAANPAPPPTVPNGGVVNAASFAPNAAVTPGGIVSVFGSNLATSNGNSNSGFPLPVTLGGIKLSMGGIDMPLFYSGTGQVNAQVPAELPANTQTSVVARAISGTTETDAVPVSVTLGAAQPGIFIVTETNAPNQGAILNPANQVVDASNPSPVGGVIVIYCTGLGATTPFVATGAAAPSSTAVTVPVTVTIGGVNAPSIAYAGLSPGFVGLYQVNVTIPAGVTVGPLVPVVLTQNGVASNTVTIAMH